MKISVAELRRPETRMHALQQFCVRAYPQEAEVWKDPTVFAGRHNKLSVSVLKAGGKAPRYLVTWQYPSIEEGWREVDAAQSAAGADVVLPANM